MVSQIQVQLIRDGEYYFYNRIEDGRTVKHGERITASRAEQIYRANDTAIQTGSVSFAPGRCSWAWTSKPTEVTK